MNNEYEYNEVMEETSTIEPEASEFEKYCAKISGKNAEGRPLVTISYQCYALEDDDNSPSKQVSYTLTTPWVQLWVDKLNPGYVGMDIAFRSYDDVELRLLWGRMNKHIRNMSKEPNKTWIFYFKILEDASLSITSKEISMVHVLNPSIFFITRELPTMQASNSESEYGLQGGNIIRMLVPSDLVSVEVTPNEEFDLDTMRAEVLREAEESAYQNASHYSNSAWNEDNTNF